MHSVHYYGGVETGDRLTLFAENIYILNGDRERDCEREKKEKQIVSSSGILVRRYGDTVRVTTIH